MTKDLYTLEYMHRNLKITSNMSGYYEKHIECCPSEIITINHNHRRIFINEVVFDIDCHIQEIYNPIWDRISTRLQQDNISHQAWHTSRSPHIHSYFEGLNLYPKEIRRVIKLLILKHYAQDDFKWIDKSKCSEDVMIRDFNSIHEITGKTKTLIYEFLRKNEDFEQKGFYKIKSKNIKNIQNFIYGKQQNDLNYKGLLNPIPAHILEQLRVLYAEQEKAPNLASNKATNSLYKQELINFLDYCLNNTLRHDGKERILFRNIVVACLLLDYNTNERHRIYYTIVKNCNTKRSINELIGWDKFLQKQKKLNFNWNEIKLWYNKWSTQEEKGKKLNV